MWRAMCSASSSTRNASPITTSSIAAETSFSAPPQRRRIAFDTSCTPARERPSRTSGAEACTSSRSCRDLVMDERLVSARSVGPTDSSFPQLVSLAAHDLRTPLATIHGFAQTLVRLGVVGQPEQRYLEMIDVASRQLAELLDELGLAARIEGGRYEPNLQPADTRELAFGAAEELGPERVIVEGEGAS